MRLQFKDILLYDGKDTTGTFGNFDGIFGAVELTGTAFDAAFLKGWPCLFIIELINSMRTDFYTVSTTCADLLVKCDHRYTSVITNVTKLAA